jgi:hypothetical protein
MSAIPRTKEVSMHRYDQDGLNQITEELLACGVHLDEPREPIEVGLLEPTEDMAPREPRARRPGRWHTPDIEPLEQSG